MVYPNGVFFAFCAPIRLEKLRSVRCRTPISSDCLLKRNAGNRTVDGNADLLVCGGP